MDTSCKDIVCRLDKLFQGATQVRDDCLKQGVGETLELSKYLVMPHRELVLQRHATKQLAVTVYKDRDGIDPLLTAEELDYGIKPGGLVDEIWWHC